MNALEQLRQQRAQLHTVPEYMKREAKQARDRLLVERFGWPEANRRLENGNIPADLQLNFETTTSKYAEQTTTSNPGAKADDRLGFVANNERQAALNRTLNEHSEDNKHETTVSTGTESPSPSPDTEPSTDNTASSPSPAPTSGGGQVSTGLPVETPVLPGTDPETDDSEVTTQPAGPPTESTVGTDQPDSSGSPTSDEPAPTTGTSQESTDNRPMPSKRTLAAVGAGAAALLLTRK